MLSLAKFNPAGFLLSRRRPQFCGLAEFKPKLLLSRPENYSKPAWESSQEQDSIFTHHHTPFFTCNFYKRVFLFLGFP